MGCCFQLQQREERYNRQQKQTSSSRRRSPGTPHAGLLSRAMLVNKLKGLAQKILFLSACACISPGLVLVFRPLSFGPSWLLVGSAPT